MIITIRYDDLSEGYAMKRKYKDIVVSKQVNISSSGDYHFRVMWAGGGRDYSLGIGFLTNEVNCATWESAPKYLHDEVEKQIADMLKFGNAKFYEFDRDGNKRYEHLRYRNDCEF